MKERIFDPSVSSLLSHELNTPISGIIGLIELLYEMNLTNPQKTYVRYIEKLATQLSNSQSKIEQIITENNTH